MKKPVLALTLSFLAGATVLAQPDGFLKARAQGQLTACKSNEKNIATALEMYASDFGGVYPQSLSRLINKNPKFDYLRYIPTCPAAGKDTYSATYKMTSASSSKAGDNFTFHCAGHNHKEAGGNPNKPAYDSRSGLIER